MARSSGLNSAIFPVLTAFFHSHWDNLGEVPFTDKCNGTVGSDNWLAVCLVLFSDANEELYTA